MRTQGITDQKLCGLGEEDVTHAEHHQGARCELLQRYAVEQSGQEDEDEAADLPYGRDVAELRAGQMEDVVEVVRDDVGVRVDRKAERRRHDGEHDESTAGGRPPHFAHEWSFSL